MVNPELHWSPALHFLLKNLPLSPCVSFVELWFNLPWILFNINALSLAYDHNQNTS